MKKNKKVNNKKKIKLKKKNIIIILIPIVLLLIGGFLVTTYIKEYNKDENKLKRYLETIEYDCTNNKCSKKEGNTEYSIYLKDFTFTSITANATLKIKNDKIIYEIKNDRQCTYTKKDYKKTDKIDETYEYNVNCNSFIDLINMTIDKYKDIVNKSGIDVN